MPNILLTTTCNRACPYCFARDEVDLAGQPRVGAEPGPGNISLQAIDQLIEFHRRSGLRAMALLGGEPTLHPQFTEIVDRVLDGGLHIKLFTGALMPPRAVARLKEVDPAHLTIIVNANEPGDFRSPEQYQRVVRTVGELASACALGFTIYRPSFSGAHLLEIIRSTGCRKNIRLGLAMPMLTEESPLLPPSQYREVAARIVQFVARAAEDDVATGFDCGFPLCMFSEAELGRLFVDNCQVKFCCDPIIDIGPDLSVWSCFALSSIDRSTLAAFSSRSDMVQHYMAKQKAYRTFGVYDGCHTCKHKRRGQCSGGCLVHVMRSFDGQPHCSRTSASDDKTAQLASAVPQA